jgi:hypothetical protein
MRLTQSQLQGVRQKVIERSKAFKAEAESLEWVAVCLIGYAERVPRHFGDNQGVLPCRVAVTNNPKKVATRPDLESPLHEIKVLELVWCPSDRHAKRLKEKLDTLLLGTADNELGLRHGWRDLDNEVAIVWPILLAEALRDIRRREEIDVYSDEERLEKISGKLRGRL